MPGLFGICSGHQSAEVVATAHRMKDAIRHHACTPRGCMWIPHHHLPGAAQRPFSGATQKRNEPVALLSSSLTARSTTSQFTNGS